MNVDLASYAYCEQMCHIYFYLFINFILFSHSMLLITIPCRGRKIVCG